jgi:hypothetical protein
VTIPATLPLVFNITTDPKLSLDIALTADITESFSLKVSGGFLLLNSGLSQIFILPPFIKLDI